MKNHLFKIFFFLLFFQLFMVSCIPQKKLLYMQDKSKESGYTNPYEPATRISENYKIQPRDYLYIQVITPNKELTEFYNITSMSGGNSVTQMGQGGSKFMSYLVDDQGSIEMPNLGKINVKGLTLQEIKEKITITLKKQIDLFTIVVQLTNTYFTILGEAGAGAYPMNKDVLNIYEALAMSGDLKTYSKRKAVRIIHATPEGKSVVTYVDLTDKNLLDSQQSYIYPNDIIYVEPIGAKVWGIGETFSFGLLTSLVTMYLLIKSLN